MSIPQYVLELERKYRATRFADQGIRRNSSGNVFVRRPGSDMDESTSIGKMDLPELDADFMESVANDWGRIFADYQQAHATGLQNTDLRNEIQRLKNQIADLQGVKEKTAEDATVIVEGVRDVVDNETAQAIAGNEGTATTEAPTPPADGGTNETSESPSSAESSPEGSTPENDGAGKPHPVDAQHAQEQASSINSVSSDEPGNGAETAGEAGGSSEATAEQGDQNTGHAESATGQATE
jgi:hypothetical protein